MSTHAGFFCVDCRERERPDVSNHMHDQFAGIMKYRATLEQLGRLRQDETLWWWALDYGRLDQMSSWFVQHIGHRLVVLSEYGGVYGHAGECNQRPREFEQEAFCRLPNGHTGDHLPGPRIVWDDLAQRWDFKEPT